MIPDYLLTPYGKTVHYPDMYYSHAKMMEINPVRVTLWRFVSARWRLEEKL